MLSQQRRPLVYLGLSSSGGLKDADYYAANYADADYDPDTGVDADSRNIIPPFMDSGVKSSHPLQILFEYIIYY